jgi:hypothetical protein
MALKLARWALALTLHFGEKRGAAIRPRSIHAKGDHAPVYQLWRPNLAPAQPSMFATIGLEWAA